MYSNISRGKVYYQEAGSGRPLLFLHGWGVTSEVFRELFLHLAKDRLVRIIDFPGFGESPIPASIWGTKEYADMVAELLDEWGWSGVDILAHSFGARVAFRLAEKKPELVGKLLLTGAAGIRRKTAVPFFKRAISKTGKVVGAFGPIGRWLKGKLYSLIGSADYLSAGKMRAILVKVVNEDLSNVIADIKHDTLLLWGEKDDATPLEDGEKINSLLENSKIEVIPNAGHYAFLDNPKLFLEKLKPFYGIDE